MTKKKSKELEDLAKDLPVVKETRLMKISGADLIDKKNLPAWDPKTGKGIKRDLDYNIRVTAEVNHFKRLKALAGMGGMPKVQEYIKNVKEKNLGK
jgi:hypothetical protein